MRNLSHYETCAVAGGFLNAEQSTYLATSSSQILLNLGYQCVLKALGAGSPGILISYGLMPAANMLVGGAVCEFCKSYFCDKK